MSGSGKGLGSRYESRTGHLIPGTGHERKVQVPYAQRRMFFCLPLSRLSQEYFLGYCGYGHSTDIEVRGQLCRAGSIFIRVPSLQRRGLYPLRHLTSLSFFKKVVRGQGTCMP